MSKPPSTPRGYHEAEQFRFPEGAIFALESETAIDYARIAAEKAAEEKAAKDAADAARESDALQQQLF